MITDIPQGKVLTVNTCFVFLALISTVKKSKDEQYLEESNTQVELITGTNRLFVFSVGRPNGVSGNNQLQQIDCYNCDITVTSESRNNMYEVCDNWPKTH